MFGDGPDVPLLNEHEDDESVLPTFVLTEAEVLRGRGAMLEGPHVGKPLAFEPQPSGLHRAVVTAYYPPTDTESELWSVRYNDDDDMADLSVRIESLCN